VYRPLHALPEAERARWERYIIDGGAVPPPRPVYRDRVTMVQGRVGLLAAMEGDGADVRFVDGEYYVCPWRTRLRVLASILSLRESGPPEVVEAFLPEAEARRAARELARVRRRDPGAVPCMLQSPWHVPIRWFVLFDEQDRRLVERTEGGHRLFYWTPVLSARRRADRALQVLRRSELAPLGEMIRDMSQWLTAFERSSMVELDYASVSDMFTWDELDDDHSAREIQAAVEALEGGDLARSAELYQGVAQHWAEVRSRESLN